MEDPVKAAENAWCFSCAAVADNNVTFERLIHQAIEILGARDERITIEVPYTCSRPIRSRAASTNVAARWTIAFREDSGPGLVTRPADRLPPAQLSTSTPFRRILASVIPLLLHSKQHVYRVLTSARCQESPGGGTTINVARPAADMASPGSPERTNLQRSIEYLNSTERNLPTNVDFPACLRGRTRKTCGYRPSERSPVVVRLLKAAVAQVVLATPVNA